MTKSEIFITLIKACIDRNNTTHPFSFCIKNPERYFYNKNLTDYYNELDNSEKDIFKSKEKFFNLLVEYKFKTEDNTVCNLHNKCKICGKEVPFVDIQHGYKNTCSQKCTNLKTEETNLKNLGVRRPLQNTKVREKHEETCYERLGVKYPSQNPDVKAKTKQKNLENFGVTCNLTLCKKSGSGSKIEKKCLSETEKILDIKLKKQYIVKYKNTIFYIDGYDPETNTCYEFLGDFWHGNLEIFDPNKVNPKDKKYKKTFGELYKETFERFDILKSMGYKIKYIWENQYKKSGLCCWIEYI